MSNYKMKDRIGEKFGFLEVVSLSDTEKTKKGTRKWGCRCVCGNIVYYETRILNDLKSRGINLSCGCRPQHNPLNKDYGDFTVVEENIGILKSVGKQWLCRCKYCGEEVILNTQQLWKRQNYVCPLRRSEQTILKKPLRVALARMKARCYKENTKDYKNYGGRGITVCSEWLDKKNGSENFIKWSFENGYKKGLTIDRINNDGNYEPTNCRWVDRFVQANNKRTNRIITYNGKTQTLKQWCRELNLHYRTTHRKIYENGISVEKAFTKNK